MAKPRILYALSAFPFYNLLVKFHIRRAFAAFSGFRFPNVRLPVPWLFGEKGGVKAPVKVKMA
jgi:hypothetical protein